MNGVTNIVCPPLAHYQLSPAHPIYLSSLLSYGFGRINSGVVHSYQACSSNSSAWRTPLITSQINFLACGLLTVVFRVIVL